MESDYKLYMIMLGCRPKGRYTEQHDVFFGIAKNLKELIPHINAFWLEADGNIHIDVWREVTSVDGYIIKVKPKGTAKPSDKKLFFINLGGYKENEFEEYHYKMLAVAATLDEAGSQSKATSFYKHFGFKGAVSHIDDKFGIDVDDAFDVTEIMPPAFTDAFELEITHAQRPSSDALNIGYLKLDKIK